MHTVYVIITNFMCNLKNKPKYSQGVIHNSELIIANGLSLGSPSSIYGQ